jgi:hypothetical protein
MDLWEQIWNGLSLVDVEVGFGLWLDQLEKEH